MQMVNLNIPLTNAKDPNENDYLFEFEYAENEYLNNYLSKELLSNIKSNHLDFGRVSFFFFLQDLFIIIINTLK